MSKTVPTWYRVTLLGVLGGAVLFSGIALVRSIMASNAAEGTLIAQVIGLMHREHADQPEVDQLTEAALAGIASSVGDPYTIYVPPRDVAEFEKQLTGTYSGIGASIAIVEDVLTIITPLEDSPAYRAGLLPDDRIVAIESVPTEGLTSEQAVERLVGEDGSEVTLTIERLETQFDVTLTREQIVSRTVRGFLRDPQDPEQWNYQISPSVAYIRITQFNEQTIGEFDAALTRATENPATRGLILDLRGNPGGLMAAAIHIADRFLSEGVVLAVSGPSVGTETVTASVQETDTPIELAVLVDSASASASEILAGALSGNSRAVAVGTRTFGKGSIQQVWPLRNFEAGEIKITQAYYQTPLASGQLTRVHRKPGDLEWGIDPSPGHYVEMSTQQLIEARDVRLELDLLKGAESDPQTLSLDDLKDPQLQAAHETLLTRFETGNWGTPGGDVPIERDPSEELARAIQTREMLQSRLDEIDTRIDELESEVDNSL